MSMKILVNDNKKVNIINKSRFIGIVSKVMTKDEVLNILNKVKEQYPDATHICYAYSLPNIEKYSDDNEPMGTAGIPILDILRKNNLTYALAIVVRYFGGIKLGSNGLIRAYSGIINELVKDNIKDIEEAYLIHIEEDYSKSDLINYLLKDELIINKEYQDRIKLDVIIKKKTLDKLSNVNYKIIEERII